MEAIVICSYNLGEFRCYNVSRTKVWQMYGEKNECGPPTPLYPGLGFPHSLIQNSSLKLWDGQKDRKTNYCWPPKPPIQNEGYNPRTTLG